MTDKVMVLVTCSSAKEAGKIGKALVEKRLAACVNISSPVRSVYRWEGKVCDEKEFVLFIKTARGLFGQLRGEVERLHSYHVPEVICLPIVDGAPNYLNWISKSVRAEEV